MDNKPATARLSWARVAIPVVLAALALAFATVAWPGRPQSLSLATGSQGGAQEVVGKAFVEVVAADLPKVSLTLVPSGGGEANVALLKARQVDLAIVPTDQKGSADLRSIAPLYREYLQIVVRRDAVSGVADLNGKRIASGPKGSHTAAITGWLLGALGVRPAEVIHGASHQDSAQALAEGRVDVALVLAGMPTPAVRQMLEVPGTGLLSLASPGQTGSILDGLRMNAPNLVTTVVPVGVYGGHPTAPVGTLGCDTVLVTRSDVDDDVVRRFTEGLFAHRAALGDRATELAKLSEHFDPDAMRFPIHPGATSFYTRKEPPFIVEWADALSLMLTLVLLAYSGVAALHSRLARQRKDRVDRYYQDIQALADAVGDADRLDELLSLREQLRELRRRAFAELAAERLAADESFTIFQDYLRTELAEVDGAIAQRRERSPQPDRRGAAAEQEGDRPAEDPPGAEHRPQGEPGQSLGPFAVLGVGQARAAAQP